MHTQLGINPRASQRLTKPWRLDLDLPGLATSGAQRAGCILCIWLVNLLGLEPKIVTLLLATLSKNTKGVPSKQTDPLLILFLQQLLS